MWRDLEVVDNFLSQAKQSDQRVAAEFSANETKFGILTQSRIELEAQLPQNVSSQLLKTESSELLRLKYDELNGVLEKRTALIAEVQQLPAKTDITNTLLHKHGSETFDSIFDSEIQRVTASKVQELGDLQSKQVELLQAISSANDSFNATKNASDTLLQRQRVLQNISTAAQSYNKLLQHYNEGQNFYAELMATKIKPLKQRVDDFMLARDMEKRMILEQLTRDIAGYTDGNNGQQGGGGAGSWPWPGSGSSPTSGGSGGSNELSSQGQRARSSSASGASNPNLSLDAPSSVYGRLECTTTTATRGNADKH